MKTRSEHLDNELSLKEQSEFSSVQGRSKAIGKRSLQDGINLRTRAVQYLARREYSRAELRSKLLPYVQSENNFEQMQPVDLDALLDDLTARGWLSDARAVSQLLHVKRSRFGIQRISHELRQRGIGEELIVAALPALKESELETARDVWQRKFARLPKDAKEKAKQIRFLQSRGFEFEVIFKVLILAEN